ncbi:ferredoxin--NADP reductase [Winogradskyella endarachnes]|uniref:2Fe-2S iron-sulfur cluster binding domain-containing protein n=1 Tax=Winogradskyella endarachnes TaxID=2681965 RepID=A0A6L6U9S7_9FLAO|nr:ferredoxin--NADP reductase [Winogradskyella endarachnes]MUU79045.1 2Fe-2S iron-sulfur cluster binding domain-containing protein [Winogradskyella endarachnes]
MSQFHSLTIKSVDKVTDNSVAITFDIPDVLKETFSFKAGQYITLKTTIKGEDIRRDYSICASQNSGNVTVAVKAVENGTFSVYANTALKAGDTLEVAEPNGRFVLEANAAKTRTIAAFAAGSGITPILSIAKTLLEEEPFSNFILVYGNKTLADAMFIDQLLQMKQQYDNRFHVHFIYSQAQEEDALFGRIEKSTVNLIVKNKYKGVTIENFYLCGPEQMIHTVKDVLIENGVKEKAIKFELFTAPVEAKTEVSTSDLPSGETKIKVVVDEEEFEFNMSQKSTILDAALKQDIDAPYSCQGGICSSCIAKVTEGTAEMRQNNILTDSEVAEGLILTCQAHPTSATIAVDFDDV